MSLTDFVSVPGKGYSIGSMIPDDHYKSLKDYHPDYNIDPSEFKMDSMLNRDSTKVRFDNFSIEWDLKQITLFRAMRFIEKSPIDNDELKLEGGTTLPNSYRLLSGTMTKGKIGTTNVVQEEMVWKAPGLNGEKFTTKWFWIPK